MMSPLTYALHYAARGWNVFPLVPQRKEPMTAHGFKDATTNAQVIESWWQRTPTANVGIATGFSSDLLVVDVDPRNGGDESLASLELVHGWLPTTIRAITGGGGQHFFFHAPSQTLRKTLAEGIDLKGAGGYVVAPPSIHPDTRRSYVWDAGAHLDETEIASAPAWLLEIAANSAKSSRPFEHVGPASESFLAVAFSHVGWVGRVTDERLFARCPWAEEHSDGRGWGDDSSAVILRPGGNRLGAFVCSHAHCSVRDTAAAIAALPKDAVAVAARKYPTGFRAAMWRAARTYRKAAAR